MKIPTWISIHLLQINKIPTGNGIFIKRSKLNKNRNYLSSNRCVIGISRFFAPRTFHNLSVDISIMHSDNCMCGWLLCRKPAAKQISNTLADFCFVWGFGILGIFSNQLNSVIQINEKIWIKFLAYFPFICPNWMEHSLLRDNFAFWIIEYMIYYRNCFSVVNCVLKWQLWRVKSLLKFLFQIPRF